MDTLMQQISSHALVLAIGVASVLVAHEVWRFMQVCGLRREDE